MNDLLRYSNHCNRLMQCSMQPLRTELGISQLEADLLLFLRNNPELNTARDAVTYRGFAKSNVSTAAESLKKTGWLSVEPDPSSRRIKRLMLRSEKETDNGWRIVKLKYSKCFAVDLIQMRSSSFALSWPEWTKMP